MTGDKKKEKLNIGVVSPILSKMLFAICAMQS